ncbi:class F sortase [Streptomyces sp. DT190]|uniref:class F sortase n=1 Tax=Streptomyces sp. DT190 TaxID=3416527 RepID=UPI003CF23211
MPPQRIAAHATPASGRWPLRLTLAEADLDAAVVPVAVRTDGQLDVPEDAKTAGWWKDTAPPGSRQGSTLIAGHLDTRHGAAVFAPLTRAKPGDRVTVATPNSTLSYRVTTVTVRRGAALPDEYTATSGPPRLVLVTCTGPYLHGRGYRDRLYVAAAPAGPSKPVTTRPPRTPANG